MAEGQARNIFYLGCAAVTAAMLLSLFSAMFRSLTPEVRARIRKKASSAPVFREARKLGLTYEAVLAAPAAALGRPAVWCLHKQQAGPALYAGDPARPVTITNPGEMPSEIYSYSRIPCRDALVEITAVRASDYLGARSVRLEARFVDYP